MVSGFSCKWSYHVWAHILCSDIRAGWSKTAGWKSGAGLTNNGILRFQIEWKYHYRSKQIIITQSIWLQKMSKFGHWFNTGKNNQKKTICGCIRSSKIVWKLKVVLRQCPSFHYFFYDPYFSGSSIVTQV